MDDGSAQRLDVQQIKRLKAESASGDSVVIAIAQGSRTFATKSSFAQVKYLRKKARKHVQFVSALRPTALALSDMYGAKAPEKLLSLRRDSLALLLSLGGLQPAARALVLEGSLGLGKVVVNLTCMQGDRQRRRSVAACRLRGSS